jgi:hypothetical protein
VAISREIATHHACQLAISREIASRGTSNPRGLDKGSVGVGVPIPTELAALAAP